jgi:hypothetical protein
VNRIVIPELLDSDAGSADEVQGSLADLRFFNRWFGGIATTSALLKLVAERTRAARLSLLEVAAGSGDVPKAAREDLKTRGLDLDVTLLDRSRAHLNGAAADTTGRSAPAAIVGDAMSLPFGDGTFDLVGCGLFAHHLDPDQLLKFIDEGLRVCRVAVLINDLIRHPLHLVLVYAGLPLYRSRLTRHDAPASVRCSYTTTEMLGLLERTRATRIELHRHYLFRMGAIAWK